MTHHVWVTGNYASCCSIKCAASEARLATGGINRCLLCFRVEASCHARAISQPPIARLYAPCRLCRSTPPVLPCCCRFLGLEQGRHNTTMDEVDRTLQVVCCTWDKCYVGSLSLAVPSHLTPVFASALFRHTRSTFFFPPSLSSTHTSVSSSRKQQQVVISHEVCRCLGGRGRGLCASVPPSLVAMSLGIIESVRCKNKPNKRAYVSRGGTAHTGEHVSTHRRTGNYRRRLRFSFVLANRETDST